MLRQVLWHRFLKRPYRLKKVIDIGTGNINIILIHGLASRSEAWKPLVDILDKEKYRIRSFDLLGFGISPKPTHVSYSTKDHARAIIHSLSKESLRNEKFIFIGHSMGCIITTHITYSWPNKVHAAILYKPPLLLNESEKRSLHKKFYQYISKKPASMANYAKIVGKFSNKLAGFNTGEEDWLPIESSLLNTILAQQTLKELRFISKPTHIVYGRFDFLVSKVKAKKLAAINPNLELHFVTEMHDIKPKSSKYLKKLIENL